MNEFQVKMPKKGGRNTCINQLPVLLIEGKPSINAYFTSIRGLALPSAAQSNRSHYQSKVFVCVSVFSRRVRLIARMQLIGFYYWRGTGSQYRRVYKNLRARGGVYKKIRVQERGSRKKYVEPAGVGLQKGIGRLMDVKIFLCAFGRCSLWHIYRTYPIPDIHGAKFQ